MMELQQGHTDIIEFIENDNYIDKEEENITAEYLNELLA